MKKRLISFLLILSLLGNTLPLQVLADQWQQPLEETVLPEPEAAAAEEADAVLTVDNGGSVSLMAVESESNASYVRQGVDGVFLSQLRLEGVTEQPQQSYLPQLVNSEGVVCLVGNTVSPEMIYEWQGDWYLDGLELFGMQDLEPDLYTLQLMPLSMEEGGEEIGPAVGGGGSGAAGEDAGVDDESDSVVLASDGVILLNKKLRIVPADDLLMYRPFLEGFYTGVESFSVRMNLDGFKEADLDALRLELTDEAGNVVARTRQEPGILYMNYDVTRLTRRMYMEEGVLLDEDAVYRLKVYYDSERTLYTGFATVGVSTDSYPTVKTAWVSDVMDAAITVDVDNFDPNTEYTIEIWGYGLDGTYTGFLTGDGQIEIELGEEGEKLPITRYSSQFSIDISWMGEYGEEWGNACLLRTPYVSYGSGSGFLPEAEREDMEEFPFVLTVPACHLAEDYVVELMDADGEVLASTDDVTVERAQGELTITGTLAPGGKQQVGPAAVMLNGVNVANMEFCYTDQQHINWNIGSNNVISSLFGVFPVRTEIFNCSEDTGYFRLLDENDEAVVTGEPITAEQGVTPSYSQFFYAFTEAQLSALTAGKSYRLELVVGTDDHAYYGGRSVTFVKEKRLGLQFGVDTQTVEIGDETMQLEIYLYNAANITLEDLQEKLFLRVNRTIYDENGNWMGSVQEQIDVESAELIGWDEDCWPQVRLQLSQPLPEGRIRIVWNGGSQVDFVLSSDSEPTFFTGSLLDGYLMAEGLPTSGAYTCKVFDETALLTTLTLELEDGKPQYLYYDVGQVEDLADGTYYLRLYHNGELLYTTESVVIRPADPVIVLSNNYNSASRVLTSQRAYLNLEYMGDYTVLRCAASMEELAQRDYEDIRKYSGISRPLSYDASLPDGPVTMYVEVAKDLFGTDSKVLEYELWLCTDNDYDLQTEAEETILVPVGGADYVLQATTELPYTRVLADFTDSDGGVTTVELSNGGMNTEGRCVFRLTIPADIEAMLPDSEVYYRDISSVRLYAVDENDVPVGRPLRREFSLRVMDQIFINGLADGALSIGNGQALEGYATANSTVTVTVTAESSVIHTYPTDASGKFTVPQSDIGVSAAQITVTDAALGSVSFALTVDTLPPAVAGGVEADENGMAVLRWSTADTDVAEFRVYRNSELMATLDSSVRSWETEYPMESGIYYVLEAEDKAGNETVVALPDGIALTETLSYTMDEVQGILRLHGTGELPDYPGWPFWTGTVRQLELPEGLTAIGCDAFSNSMITAVTIPDSVEEIGDYAFAWCQNLREVKLGSGVKTLYNQVFAGSAMETIHIPASVELIESSPFDNCLALHTITVAEENETYYARDGVLFETDGSMLVYYPAGKTDTAYAIPDGTTAVWDGAFRYSQLQELTVPDSVEEIGYNNFFSCSRLTTVHLPAQMEYYFGLSFVLCPSLDTITVAEGDDPSFVIENDCLYDAEQTELIVCFDKDGITEFTAPETMSWMRDGAFSDCTALETVVLPGGMSWISWYGFSGCTALREITIPSSVTNIDYYAFRNCHNLQTVTYGGSEEMWQNLMENLPEGNEVLKSVNMEYVSDLVTEGSCGSSLTWSFDEESGLLTIEGSGDMDWYGGEDQVPWHMFRDQITAVSLPEGLTALGSYAFLDCENLTAVTLPESLERIEQNAFQGSGLTAIHIPAGVWSISVGVFTECDALREITVSADNKWYRVEEEALLSSDSSAMLLHCFSQDAYYTVPDGVKIIDNWAFCGKTTLQSVVLPAGVRSIYSSAFWGCTELHTVTLPASLINFGWSLFEETALAEVYYGGTESMWQRLAEDLAEMNNDTLLSAKVLCSQPTSAGGDLDEDIQWSLNLTTGEMVITGEGFSLWHNWDEIPWLPYMQEIRSLRVEEGVLGLFGNAFYDAANLKTVSLPETFAEISSGMFSGTALETFRVPADAYINGDAFDRCENLTGFTVSEDNDDNMVAIDGVLFYDYETSDQMIAYPGGKRDTAYALPGGTTHLGSFSSNPWLQKLTLCEGVTYLYWELQGCSGLQELELPGSIRSVDADCLAQLENLQTVRYAGTQAMWDEITCSGEPMAIEKLQAMVQVSETFVPSGQVGSLSWSLDASTGVLAITGTGIIDSSIGSNAWSAYSSMVKTLTIGEGITEVYGYSFQYMENLAAVTLPDSLTYLGGSVFYGSALTALHIPAGVKSIDSDLLCGCSHAAAVTVDEENEKFLAMDGVLYERYDADQLCLTAYPPAKTDTSFTAAANTVAIAAYAAMGNPYLTELTLPEGLKCIYYSAFAGCTALTTLHLPSTISMIDSYAFDETDLTTVSYNGSRWQWDNNVSVWENNGRLVENLQTRPGGICGPYAYWTMIEETGTLRITGWGTTDTFTEGNTPWYGYADQITAVEVTEGITFLGSYAFSGLTKLTDVSLPETLTELGYRAFYGCTALEEIILPDELSYPGGDLFENCTALKQVTLPANLQNLSSGMFKNCTALAAIELPMWLSNFNPEAFTGCTALAAVNTAADNPCFWSENGVLYSGTTLIYYPIGKTDVSFTVSEQATEVGYNAFLRHGHVQEVVIPDGVDTIATNAFAYCDTLTKVHLPQSLREIFYSAFHDSGLTEVVYAGNRAQWSHITIGEGNDPLLNAKLTCLIAGDGGDCGEVTWFYDEQTTVLTISGTGAMADYTAAADTPWYKYAGQITSVVVEPGVTAVGSYAFAELPITTAVLSDTVERLESHAFSKCTNLSNLTLPDSLDVVSSGVFSQCHSLKELTIPAGVSFFSSDAVEFSGMTAIHVEEGNSTYSSADGVLYKGSVLLLYPDGKTDTAFVVPDGVTALAEKAFYCAQVQDVTLPYGITEIPVDCFLYSNLQTLRMTAGVKTVGDSAFSGSPLATVYFTGFPAQWQSIDVRDGNYAFSNAQAIIGGSRSGTSADGLTWTVDYDTAALTIEGSGSMTAYSSVEALPWAADADYITKAVVEEGVTRVHVTVLKMPELAQIHLPASCTDLSSWTTESARTDDYPALAAIHVAEGNKSYRSLDGVLYSADGTILYRYPEAKAGDSFTVPETVTILSPHAFRNAAELQTVTIPQTVEMLFDDTFSNCTGLKTVIYGGTRGQWDAYKVDLGENVEIQCSDVSGTWGELSWHLNGTTGHLTITGQGPMNDIYGADAWKAYQGEIRTVELGEGITSIGIYTFQNCQNLTTVKLPESLTRVGDYAFRSCFALESLSFPAGLEHLGAYCLSGCTGLQSLFFAGDKPAHGSQSYLPAGCKLTVYEGRWGWDSSWYGLLPVAVTPAGTERYFSGEGGSVTYDKDTGVITAASKNLTKVTIPAELGIDTIGADAFAACSGLTYAEIPVGVTAVEAGAFHGTALEQVFYGGTREQWAAMSIGANNQPLLDAARNYNDLCGDSPDGLSWTVDTETGTLTVSGTGAMENYTSDAAMPWAVHVGSIRKLVAEEGVTSVSRQAMEMEGLTELFLPATYSDTALEGTMTPDRNPDLAAIHIAEGNTRYRSADGVVYSASGNRLHFYPASRQDRAYTVAESTVTIGSKAFYGSTNLTELVLPDTVQRLQNQAFTNCTALAVLHVPAGLTNVGTNVLTGTALTEVYYGGTASMWQRLAAKGGIADAAANATIHYSEQTGTWGQLTWVLSADGILTVSGEGPMENMSSGGWRGYADDILGVVIEEGITSIGSYAFQYCRNLTDVTLPESLTRVGDYAFYDCRSLKSLSFPAGLEYLGAYCLNSCTGLERLFFAGDKPAHGSQSYLPAGCKLTVYEGRWGWDQALFGQQPVAVTPEGTERYFSGQGGSVTYNKDTGTITEAAKNLTATIVPADLGITAIAADAFTGCAKLVYAVVPTGVTDIAEGAFPAFTKLMGAAGSAAQTYARQHDMTFAVPALTLSPDSGSTIGGKTARVTAAMDLYEILPLTLTYTGQTALTYKEAASGGTRVFEMDLTALTEGEYTFTVANEAYGVSAQALYLLDTTAPGAVTGLMAHGGNLQITLTWDQAAEANVSRYDIYRAEAPDGERTQVMTIYNRNTVSWTDTTVAAEVPYWYWITATDVFGQVSEPSGAATASAHKDEVPPEITFVSPENGTTVRGTMQLIVRATDDIALASITAQVSEDQETWTSLGTVETGGSATFSCDTTQWEETVIYIRLSAADKAGNTAEGHTVYRYAVDNKAPAAITGLSVKQALSTIVTLGWDDVPDQDFSHFLVEQKNGETWNRVRTVNDALGINITGLTPSTGYVFRVSAYDLMGNRGEAAEISVITAADTTAPVITGILPASMAVRESVRLEIHADDDTGVTEIAIWVSLDGGATWQQVHSQPKPGNPLRYDLDVTDMPEGVIRVRPVAKDAAGNSSDSSETAPFVEYKVDRTAPDAPVDLTASSGSGFILLAWPESEADDSAGYDLYRAESAEGPFTCIRSNAMVLTLRDNSVEYGKTYYYYLQVRDQAGNLSEPSEIISCHCEADKEAPKVLSISPSGKDTVPASASVRVKVSDNNQLAALGYSWSEDSETWTEGAMELSGSDSVQTLPIELTKLSGETLHLKVWCTDISGLRSQDFSVTYTVDGKAPAVPVLTGELTDTGIALQWSASPDADTAGYILYRREASASGWTRLLQRSAGSASYSELDTAVEIGRSYQYYLQVMDRCGNAADSDPVGAIAVPEDWSGGKDVTAPQAVISGSSVGTVGIELVFDSRYSWDDREVVSWNWDFGDGSTSQLKAPAHAYAKAGSYTVTLTVADEAGNEHASSVVVQIKEKQVLGTLQVQVNDENGNPVPQAGVYFDLGDEEMVVYYTNSIGQVTMQAPVGVHSVGAYLEHYLPAKKDVEILAGATSEVTLVTVQKEIVTGELTVRRMTLEEIVAAGIDVHDPANQEVFEFNIHLVYGTTPLDLTTQVNSEGETIKDPDPIVIEDDNGGRHKLYVGVLHWPGGWGGGGSGGSGGGGGTGGKKEIPTVVVLDIPGTASWLKDFFEVRLTVLNQADEEFYLDDCLATLNVPSGLTLMDSNYTTAHPDVSMGSIGGQSSGVAYWILRGDKAGWYDLSADFSANLRDFDAAVSARFETKEPFEVRQNAGLSLQLEVENTILADTDGALKVGLRNDHELPYYMPNIQLDKNLVELIRTYKMVGHSKTGADANMDELNPGETLWYEYIIPRENWDTLTKREDENFYLHEAIVQAMGGTTELPVNVSELPPCSISADKIVVMQRNASGEESPVELINLDKNYVIHSKLPTLVIYTYALQEDDTYVLADMEVTVKDPGVKDGEEGLEPTREGTGKYVYEGYDMYTLKNDKSYSITVTAKRNGFSRCAPVEIPVIIRGGTAEKGYFDVQVYGMSGGVTEPLTGATVSLLETDFRDDTGEKGGVRFHGVPLGYQQIRIEKSGYLPVQEVIQVSDKGKFYFTLSEDPDPGNSKVVQVNNSLSSYTTGNVTVVPEGHMTGTVFFTPVHQMADGDTFLRYRGQLISNGRVKETVEFASDNGFSLYLQELKEGDRIRFAVVYENADGVEKCSKYTDSMVIVTDAPGFFENLVYDLQHVQSKLSLNPGKLVEIEPTKFIKAFAFSAFAAGRLDYDGGDSYDAAMGFVNGFSFSKSEVKPKFPIAAKYDPNGTLTLSVIIGKDTKSEVQGGVMAGGVAGNENGVTGYALAAAVSEKLNVSHSESVGIDFIIQYNTAMDTWDLTIRGSISADQSLQLAKANFFYNLAYVSVNGEMGETIGFKLFEYNVGPLNTDGIADLQLTLEEIMVKFGLKAAAGVQAFNDDWASAGLFFRGDLSFNFVPSVKLDVNASIGGEYNVLCFGGEKDFVKETWTLFSQQSSGGYSLRDVALQSETPLRVTAMPKDLMYLFSEDPDLFVDDVFANTHARLALLPNGDVIMVWLAYTGDVNNPVQVHAAVRGSAGWTNLGVVDDDGTFDFLPFVASTDTGAVAVWTDSTSDLYHLQEVTYGQLQQQMPGMLGVTAAFYDAASGTWSAPVQLNTDPTAAASPVAVSDGSRTMTAWIANDSSLDYSADTPEYIGWALLENGQIIGQGTVPADGLDLTELKLGCSYGQFRLAVLADNGTTQKICGAEFEGTGWTELAQCNTIATDDSVLTYSDDGTLYYLNSGRIIRDRSGSSMQVLSGALLEGVVTDLHASETDAGTVLTWSTTVDSQGYICMALVQEDGSASEPVVVRHSSDGLVSGCDTAAYGGGVMLAAKASREAVLSDGETALVHSLSTPVITMESDLVLAAEGVQNLGTLYPGAKISTMVAPVSMGLGTASGFNVFLARDPAGSDRLSGAEAFGLRTATVQWTVPEDYAGEDLYVIVRPESGTDPTPENNAVLLDNVVRDVVLRDLTYVGAPEGKDTFLLTVANEGLAVVENVPVSLNLLQEETDDQVLTSAVVERLESGETITLALTLDQALDLTQNQRLAASAEQLQFESDFSNNRTYLTVMAQKAAAGLLIVENGWLTADGESAETFGTEAMTYRADLENLGEETDTVCLMAACYDENGKFLRMELQEKSLEGEQSDTVEVTLTAAQLKDASTVKAFLLNSADEPICEAEKLTKAAD